MNKLAKETSPYLLQHAHNPVDWYPWGPEALQKAVQEDKPILVSIGYAACHWCHVMERESFEDEATAQIMNQHFVNIKIDREERPDLDHIYMDALQAMTGSGGWPLNVFLTPEAKPFYGGTYFPPIPAYGRASWKEVLEKISHAFRERRNEINQQADQLTGHLEKSNYFGNSIQEGPSLFTKDLPEAIAVQLLKVADREEGGFSKAPKFPQTFSIQFLLHHYYYTENQDALKQACLSLDKMIQGGIYDQLEGGFARYATDNDWLIPHFEKMLYDNALLVNSLCEAYQLTQNPEYAAVIRQTLDFVNRAWTSPEGGFYSAFDADSEGEEGKYYVWDYEEVITLLGDASPLFCTYFDITPGGNWEGKNILRRLHKLENIAANYGLSETEARSSLQASIAKLLHVRSKREKPLLDDKIILGWNALMVQAYAKAFMALGEESYRKKVVETLQFIDQYFHLEGEYYHTYKNGVAKHPAFLDDLAYWVEALIIAQEITSDTAYLLKAREITAYLQKHFADASTDFFFFTPDFQKDIIVRKKEVYDGATPSGNSTMARNLHDLAMVFDLPEWKNQAIRMVVAMQTSLLRYPVSFGKWAQLFQGICYGIPEIALVGERFEEKHLEFLRIFIPQRIYQSAATANDNFPLLAGKSAVNPSHFYPCKQYRCLQPILEVPALKEVLKNL